MAYKIAIKNNATGEIRLHKEEGEWDGDYMWTEGNYSCDCNRALFWMRANGETDIDIDCGETAFSCPYAELADGTQIKLDN